MLKSLLKPSRRFISVYQGISPSLLATLSLSSCLKTNIANNNELVDALKKNGIIFNQDLIQTMRNMDRKNFLVLPQVVNKEQFATKINYYENKPFKIEGNQCMTDIFTHAVILQKAADYLKKKNYRIQNGQINILDIGTGHGYIAFVLANFMQKVISATNSNFQITGIDTIPKSIQYCEKLKSLLKFNTNLNFENVSVDKFLNEKHNIQYDLIIGGFYISPLLQQRLIKKLKREGLGIWASDGKEGQELCTFEKSDDQKIKRQQIMATMFSEPIIETQVSKYFVESSDGNEQIEKGQEMSQQQIQKLQNEVREELIRKKKQERLKQKQGLRNRLKEQIKKHQQRQGKNRLTLEEMKEIPEIKQILSQLQKFK